MTNQQPQIANDFMDTVLSIEHKGATPDFWLRHPELLVVDQFLGRFESSLRAFLGDNEGMLSVHREPNSTVYQVSSDTFGSFLYLRADDAHAVFRGFSFVDAAFWEKRIRQEQEWLPNLKAEYEDVKNRKRTERTKNLGFPLWYKTEWAMHEKDLKERIDGHDKLIALYEKKRDRSRLLEAWFKEIESLLIDSGYRVKWDKWGEDEEEHAS